MQDITIQIKSGDRGKVTMPAVYLLASKDEADKKEKQRGDRTEEEEEERGHVRRSIGPWLVRDIAITLAHLCPTPLRLQSATYFSNRHVLQRASHASRA